MNDNIWLHRFAVLLSFCTLFLIFAGGMVTSTGSGLAVPDWPLSYGQVFPPMVGGIFYEHGHRLVATAVGILTIVLAVWLWKREDRAWMRRLGVGALMLVIVQGVLGGLTVLLLLPIAVSVAHAGIAELFFCTTVAIAVFTSPKWKASRARIEDHGGIPLGALTKAAAAAIYVQILLGALMRHTSSGLAIPDFPLSFGQLIPPQFTRQILVNFAHRCGALAVAVLVVLLLVAVLRRQEARALRTPAVLLFCALCGQVTLGAFTVWSGKAEVITTFHVAGGAFTLACGLILALVAHRVLLPAAAGDAAVGAAGVNA